MVAKIIKVSHGWSSQPSLGIQVARSHLGLVRGGAPYSVFESSSLYAVKQD